MTQELYLINKASQEQLHQNLQHEAIMNNLIAEQEYKLFQMLRPSLSKDGDRWCVLYGENLQTGIAGFGKSPYEAILEFNKAFNKN